MIYNSILDLYKDNEDYEISIEEYIVQHIDKILNSGINNDEIAIARKYLYSDIWYYINIVDNFYSRFDTIYIEIKEGSKEMNIDIYRELSNIALSYLLHQYTKIDYLNIIKSEVQKMTSIWFNSIKNEILDDHDKSQLEKFLFPNICLDSNIALYLIDKYLWKKSKYELKELWSEYC